MPPSPNHETPHFVAESLPNQPLPVAQLPDEAAPPCQNGLVLVHPPCPRFIARWVEDRYQAILARWRNFVWQLRHRQWLPVPATCSCNLLLQPAPATCDLLLQPAPATCSCDLLLQPAPATCSCNLLLQPRPAPATCSCDLLLQPAPATCSCNLLLQPAPATCSCNLLLRPAPATCN